MPGRQSTRAPSIYQTPQAKHSRNSKRNKATRNLNALAIAEQQLPNDGKINRARLGESEARTKRRRIDQSDDDEDRTAGEEVNPNRKISQRSENDDNGLEYESDSSGNQWTVGVNAEDDSDIDSEEAFGESDEERFEDFSFNAKDSKGSRARERSRSMKGDVSRPQVEEPRSINLCEDEIPEGQDGMDRGESELDFHEEGMDLADILDHDSDDDQPPNHKGDLDEAESDLSVSDNEVYPEDISKLALLREDISRMQPRNKSLPSGPISDAHESHIPSQYGIAAHKKLTIEDIAGTVQDSDIKKSLKLLKHSDMKDYSKNQLRTKTLSAPLPARQQARLDRSAAYEKTKESLGRWIETVKQNRRADHLVFPIKDPDQASRPGERRLIPRNQSSGMTNLELSVQNVLHESGLVGKDGKTNDEQIQRFEELESNKLPIEEVLTRRAELRRQRDLLFREEIRARRIKKIKSKSYRKIHRKERERNASRLREAGVLEDDYDSAEDRERNDRRRAEERMGARHREGRWAKAMKDSGRAQWDDEARNGVSAMAQRNEELRRRMEGKPVREDEEFGGFELDDRSVSGLDDDESDKDSTAWVEAQLSQMDKGLVSDDPEQPTSRLANMEFMKNAEAARRAQNKEEIDALRKKSGCSDMSDSEQDSSGLGRRSYGPKTQAPGEKLMKTTSNQNEFEEPLGSEEEDNMLWSNASDDNQDLHEAPVRVNLQNATDHGPLRAGNGPAKEQRRQSELQNRTQMAKSITNGSASENAGKSSNSTPPQKTLLLSETKVKAHPTRAAMQSENKAITVMDQADSDMSQDEDEEEQPISFRNADLAKRAFAGDDVVDQFEEEKAKLVHEDQPQIIDHTMPGWGTWTGKGVSKRAARPFQHHRVIERKPGIAPAKRKDAKLKDVIVSERRSKKTSKYLSGQLPHPFESRAQYERSLRLPVGPEWTTKETVQSMTMPRLLVKPGIIQPMIKPMA